MKSLLSVFTAVVTFMASFGFAQAEMTKDCPVTGKGTSMPVEYKKSLNFCTTKCKEEFDKNPKLQVTKIAAYVAKDGKCPMCARKADAKITSEFKASVGVCCRKCVAKFSADPDKYIAKALGK
jgi:YHS domain-containing protein